MAKTVVGLDIGTTTLRAVEVSGADRARPKIKRYREIPVPIGAVSRGEVIEPNTVASALKHLWSLGGFSSKRVILGMGNQRVLSRDLTVPKESIERIRESLPFQVQDMLPIPVADALLDFYPVSETMTERGPAVSGLLIAAAKDAVLANVSAVELAGLVPIEVDLIPFALDRVLLSRQNVTGTVALIDIGAATTSVIIATNGVPQFVRIIASGGADVTDAIASRLELPDGEAENLKRVVGLSYEPPTGEDDKAAGIIREIVTELLGSIRKTVGYFMNTRPTEPVSHIVLTGGGSMLTGLPDALGVYTRLPIIPGDPFASIALSRSVHTDDLRDRHSSLTVALGLALGRAAA
jgi:type IV pilus assembly protein PilM